MGYETRISKAFEGALKLPLSDNSKYVLFSDCHRGVGTSNDNFLKNQHLYFAACHRDREWTLRRKSDKSARQRCDRCEKGDNRKFSEK